MWMRALRQLVALWWRWALAEIHPLHDDVPMIVRRIRELQR
jgi:hypothetical protein